MHNNNKARKQEGRKEGRRRRRRRRRSRRWGNGETKSKFIPSSFSSCCKSSTVSA
jgi:hypothetical protein